MNLSLAQAIQVEPTSSASDRPAGYVLVAVYNDLSRAVLAIFPNEKAARDTLLQIGAHFDRVFKATIPHVQGWMLPSAVTGGSER